MKFFSHAITPGLGARRNLILPFAVLLFLPIAGLPAQDFTYTNNNGTITITGYTGPGGYVTIPSTIDGLPVGSIGDFAFWQTASLTNLTIPDSVTSIGDGAFDGCQNLTSVTIGNGVTGIGYAAFNFCTSLTNISIPDSVTNIKDGFNSIGGGGAFSYCASLTNVMVGNSVTNIGDWAFYLCTSLRSVYCRGNAPRAGTGLFFNTSNVTVYYVPDTTGWEPTFGGRPTVLWNQAQDFNYTNTNGTITITGYTGPGGAVAIPSTIDGLPVTSIGDWAFTYSTVLTIVTIPDSVTNIGDYAFAGCSNLASVTVGKGVTTIGSFAFNNCTRLTSITLPDSVTNIKDGGGWAGGAFGFCANLTNVLVGSSVTNIGVYAFLFCTSLTSVTIPDSVLTIGFAAFQSCTNLENVAIGKSVTDLGYAFSENCPNLAGVYFRGNAPSLGVDPFVNNFGANTTVYYLSDTTGWGPMFGGRPTALWNPLAQTSDGSFGVRQNRFGFNIVGTPDIPLVVEATTNLVAHPWVPLQSCTLTNGLIYFSDARWTNYPSRVYRIRSP